MTGKGFMITLRYAAGTPSCRLSSVTRVRIQPFPPPDKGGVGHVVRSANTLLQGVFSDGRWF